MTWGEVEEGLRRRIGDRLLSFDARDGYAEAVVDPGALEEAARALLEMGFDHVKGVTGVDYPGENRMEVVWHVSGYEGLRGRVLGLKTSVPRDKPEVKSLAGVWPSAEWFENETYDLLGVVFKGHPSPGRILLGEDWGDLFPLRKDFKIPVENIMVEEP